MANKLLSKKCRQIKKKKEAWLEPPLNEEGRPAAFLVCFAVG